MAASVELMNLTDEFDRVRIGTKLYRFIATTDEIIFEKLPSSETSVENKVRGVSESQLKIKCNEILFVRKHLLYDDSRRSRCNSDHRHRIVNYKYLNSLIAKEAKNATINSNSTSSKYSKRESRITTPRNSSCSLGIYHVLRAGKFRWKVSLVICTFENEALCEKWLLFLHNLKEAHSRPNRLLIFVNPFGGKGRAAQVYKNYVDGVLKLCDISATVITTQRANHAREVIIERDLREYDGILSVGGDGLFNEIMNGLLVRTQNDCKTDLNNTETTLTKPRLKLGPIPAGSTNALAYTVHGTDDPLTAVLHVVIGDSIGVDVCSIHCGTEFHTFACTAASYGYLGDVLKDSETLRYLGPPRYLVSGVKMAIRHPWYKGRIDMKVVNIKKEPCCGDSEQQRCHAKCELCVMVDKTNESKNPTADEYTYTSSDEEFLHLVGIITPCISKFSPGGLSPTCHLGDGYLHLALVSRISRWKNFSFIRRVMSKRADHMTQNYVKLLRVTEFSFTADYTSLNNNGSKTEPESQSVRRSTVRDKYLGSWNVDGELLAQPNETIYMKMHKQLMTLFGRGIEISPDDNKGCSSLMKLKTCVCCNP